ncbi:MAG: hypothetical protein JXA94_05845 [Parachlamydiales bacterium]|nr:hypothetical protein [Parachlamydiales bacterium]
MIGHFKNALSNILDNVYPKYCLACKNKLNNQKSNFFCELCISYFSLTQSNNENNWAATFENFWPINSLYQEIKKNNLEKIFKVSASYMLIKVNQMNWPNFDKIVPYKISFFNKNHIFFLAYHLSKILKIPIGYKVKNDEKILIVNDFMNEEIFSEAKENFKNCDLFAIGLFFKNPNSF